MNVRQMCGVNETSGEVGIEIEVEGSNLPARIQSWNQVHDGSLRGESCEYVLIEPVDRCAVSRVLNNVKQAYLDFNTKVKSSERQSIHIHINVQELNFPQLFNFIILYLIYEDLLVKLCGESRGESLFCVKSSGDSYLIDQLEKVSENQATIRALASDSLRYSSLNVTSLHKYGSLEFRSMRGTDEFELVEEWISLLLCLKDFAIKFKHPKELLDVFYDVKQDKFTDLIFKDKSNLLTYSPNYSLSIKRGIRKVSNIAYLPEWSKEKDKEEEVVIPQPTNSYSPNARPRMQSQIANGIDSMGYDLESNESSDISERIERYLGGISGVSR